MIRDLPKNHLDDVTGFPPMMSLTPPVGVHLLPGAPPRPPPPPPALGSALEVVTSHHNSIPAYDVITLMTSSRAKGGKLPQAPLLFPPLRPVPPHSKWRRCRGNRGGRSFCHTKNGGAHWGRCLGGASGMEEAGLGRTGTNWEGLGTPTLLPERPWTPPGTPPDSFLARGGSSKLPLRSRILFSDLQGGTESHLGVYCHTWAFIVTPGAVSHLSLRGDTPKLPNPEPPQTLGPSSRVPY